MSDRAVQILVIFVAITIGVELYHGVDNYLLNRREEKFLAQKEADSKAMKELWYNNENLRADQILRWETEERKADEAFKDSVRRGYYQKRQHQSMVLWWIPDIPDLSSGVATLLFWIATTIVGALVTALIYVYKQQMDFQKAMLPLLSEIKTLLLLK